MEEGERDRKTNEWGVHLDVLDASEAGNMARDLPHSCPEMKTNMLSVDGKKGKGETPVLPTSLSM